MIDEWSGLADLLANLIEKYASVLENDGSSATENKFHEKSEESVSQEKEQTWTKK